METNTVNSILGKNKSKKYFHENDENKSKRLFHDGDEEMTDNKTNPHTVGKVDDFKAELSDTKNKLRIITQKFQHAKKERDQLKKDNQDLQDEVIQLQS